MKKNLDLIIYFIITASVSGLILYKFGNDPFAYSLIAAFIVLLISGLYGWAFISLVRKRHDPVLPAVISVYAAASFIFVLINIVQIDFLSELMILKVKDTYDDKTLILFRIAGLGIMAGFLSNISRAIYSVHELDKGFYGVDSRWGDYIKARSPGVRLYEWIYRFIIAFLFLILDQLLWVAGNKMDSPVKAAFHILTGDFFNNIFVYLPFLDVMDIAIQPQGRLWSLIGWVGIFIYGAMMIWVLQAFDCKKHAFEIYKKLKIKYLLHGVVAVIGLGISLYLALGFPSLLEHVGSTAADDTRKITSGLSVLIPVGLLLVSLGLVAINLIVATKVIRDVKKLP